MVVVTLVIGAIAIFASFIYIERLLPRLICTVVAGAILLGSIAGIVGNYYEHFGMHKVTTTSSKQIYSADTTGKMKMILFQPIGTAGKENVYIYTKKANAKKVSHTKANEYTNNKLSRIKSNKAYVRKTEVRWQYKSDAYKFWFGIADNNNKLVKSTNHFYIPNEWFVLSTTQAKELRKQMSSQSFQAQAKKQATAYVGSKMKEAIMKDPSLMTDKKRQGELGQKFAAEYQAVLLKETIAKLK
ncbi:hypothetical protein JCM15457_1559 [Liquorilactobacillus sucicola DSM 21376 = JCM 15457]|uniref:DUF4811 domain-containing protein n=1 Tax=Liquorilactobacillus sucicola DSM 21376 = JCM 15457 TaxID=1423806 RepID=A0A023CXL8_9LACO|nr:DUF4811 domain-containing protein [Liquorilactobacillus sucicola]KRN07125.1 hypothetical protein FD15_GL000696 [Liquorilactobacillus sucicola DSM 21376 = JCM 15457]GAJ26622.1 hypothetical protein JCM15457_1559 [Liquorilactobacillus sucicola DSM 21376 = JCM 15457]